MGRRYLRDVLEPIPTDASDPASTPDTFLQASTREMAILLNLLPEQAFPLIVAGLLMAAIFGIVAPRAVVGTIVGLLILTLLAPVIQELFGSLGLTWQVVILVGIGMAFLRGLFTLLLGRGAADRLIANLAYDLIRLPFRLVTRAFGMALNRARRD